jgi:hypothetical protein
MTKTLVSNVLEGLFRSAVGALQSAVPEFRQIDAALCNVLSNRSAAQCAAEKVFPTQWLEGGDSTTALLFLKKNISTYTHTYACAYRGSIGTALHVLCGSIRSADLSVQS